MLRHIRDAKTPKEAWENLKKNSQKTNEGIMDTFWR